MFFREGTSRPARRTGAGRPDARRDRLARESDEQLMADFRGSGSQAAFEELAGRYLAPAYRAALSMLGDHAAAEDALQECFVKVIRARRSYRPEMRFGGWFYTILKNACRDHLRRPRLAGLPEGLPPAGLAAPDPAEEVQFREAAEAACRALTLLPPPEREVLALRIYGELSFAETAAICGISEEAAKKRAYRGLASLRRRLADRR